MSVSPPGANMMMKSQKNAGSAESGYGVVLSGFYAPNAQAQDLLSKLDVDQGPFSEIALHESEGWTVFLGAREEPGKDVIGMTKIGFYRRESHKFFEDLPAWLFRTKAASILRMTLSQSSGFLSLTLLYAENGSGV